MAQLPLTHDTPKGTILFNGETKCFYSFGYPEVSENSDLQALLAQVMPIYIADVLAAKEKEA